MNGHDKSKMTSLKKFEVDEIQTSLKMAKFDLNVFWQNSTFHTDTKSITLILCVF